MKLVSWNVNGLRAALKNSFMESFASMDPDIMCLQETRVSPHEIHVPLDGYHLFWNSAKKRGYSGTAVFSRREPLGSHTGWASKTTTPKAVSLHSSTAIFTWSTSIPPMPSTDSPAWITGSAGTWIFCRSSRGWNGQSPWCSAAT